MDASAVAYSTFSIHDDRAIVESEAAPANRPTRGSGWVLRWAASLATILFSFVRLVDFGYQLAAERTLHRAARAGAWEATLPRATFQSVSQTVERRLEGLAARAQDWQVHLEQNGRPVHGLLSPREGDRFSVVVVMDGGAALPGWLHVLSFWAEDRPIVASAGRELPDRKLHKGGKS